MNLINLFGYVMCLAGFALMALFSLQVQKLVTTRFDIATIGMAIAGAVLIFVGYGLTTIGRYDYE